MRALLWAHHSARDCIDERHTPALAEHTLLAVEH
tara:strand:+ start:1404 stop:1505 length:102 start_codon:yes stop_codon:yes gene_type:complete